MAAAVGFLQTMCRKTKLCKYYAHGRCTRRQNCDFAHSIEELRPVPDLSCTKVCPMLVRNGRCDDSTCTFAHEKGELRKVRLAGAGRIMDAFRPQEGARTSAWKPPTSTAEASSNSATTMSPEAATSSSFMSRQTTPNEGAQLQHSSSSGELNEVFSEIPPPPVPDFVKAMPDIPGHDRQMKVDAPAGYKPPPGWDWGAKFHKTALCAFHRQGKCNKGAACHFAHGEEELKPLPNLFRTKLCMKLLSTGHCSDPSCRYAHSRDELRNGPPSMDADMAWDEGFEEEDDDGFPMAFGGQPMEGEPEAAPFFGPLREEEVDIKVSVKNTFLTVEDEEPPCLPPKAKTQPNLAPTQEEEEDIGGLSAQPASVRKEKSWPLDEVASGVSSDSLCVKNTFLTFEELPSLDLPPKAMTQPDLAGSNSDSEEEEAESPWVRQASAPAASSRDFASPPADLPLKVPLPGTQSLREVGLDVAEVLVKNTFLTIEEPNDLCLPSKAKSSPEMSKLLGLLREEEDEDEEEEEDGAVTEGSTAPASSTEEFTSPAPSWGSAARRLKESTVLDSVEMPIGLPPDMAVMIEREETAAVPVCAVQKVDQLTEDPEMEVKDFTFALPSRKKVLLKPGALAAQGQPARAAAQQMARLSV